jgi:hypothetical protein
MLGVNRIAHVLRRRRRCKQINDLNNCKNIRRTIFKLDNKIEHRTVNLCNMCKPFCLSLPILNWSNPSTAGSCEFKLQGISSVPSLHFLFPQNTTFIVINIPRTILYSFCKFNPEVCSMSPI